VKRRTGDSDMQQLMATWRGFRNNPGTGSLADPFAVNPIRRSLALVLGCSVAIVVPWLISDAVMTAAMLSVTWLAITGLVFGLPVLVWSLFAAAIREMRAHMLPSIDELGLTPRVKHLLSRHGYDTIEDLETETDAALLMLSNLDVRGVREIRRAIALWKYRRWQERGFPNTSS
jgi:hypothetical protein